MVNLLGHMELCFGIYNAHYYRVCLKMGHINNNIYIYISLYIVFIVLATECGGDGKLMMDDGQTGGGHP